MLHDGYPSVRRRARILHLALVHVLEIDLGKLGLIGINRAAGESRHHPRVTRGRITIPQKLKITVRRNRLATLVGNFVVDVDNVTTTPERVALYDIKAARLRGTKFHQ